ncbi:hypothetical protein SEA_ZETA1847_56 [Microbacterium phage Zeta1847]|uniref:Uncharacterized protein n=1 Tax=Microbacterium phage Zeta1847 TaxID=2201444 RepID=A0A2Z4Q9N1_9CAUD|nr:hypothetical protein HOT46_gp56 [Microbacterium phage Zeta1847]AWY06690.1 hypothetical protein SEA_ZETA1847_56 [Microbacterium phage Zeta1847]
MSARPALGVLSPHTLPSKGSTMSTVPIAPASPAPGAIVGAHIDIPVDWEPLKGVSFDDIVTGPSSELLVEPLNPHAPHRPKAAHRGRMRVNRPVLQQAPRDGFLAELRAAFRRATEAAA